MFDAEVYMNQLCDALVSCFGDRLVYVGLQGSYMRGEATERSDIDPMVVIDDLSITDLNHYRQIISTLAYPELSCGFLCGKNELENWNPLEICHLRHTTMDIRGELASLVPTYTEQDVRNFVKMSVNNLYHEITHRYIHATDERNMISITGSYKGVFYIRQNLHYLETGSFLSTKSELLRSLSGLDRDVLATSIALGNGEEMAFHNAFTLLHGWCQSIMLRLS